MFKKATSNASNVMIVKRETCEELVNEFFRNLQSLDFSSTYQLLKARKQNFYSEKVEEKNVYNSLINIFYTFAACEESYYSLNYFEKSNANNQPSNNSNSNKASPHKRKSYQTLLEKYAKAVQELNNFKMLIDQERHKFGFISETPLLSSSPSSSFSSFSSTPLPSPYNPLPPPYNLLPPNSSMSNLVGVVSGVGGKKSGGYVGSVGYVRKLESSSSSSLKGLLSRMEELCEQIVVVCKLRVQISSLYSDWMVCENVVLGKKELEGLKEKISSPLSKLSKLSHPLLAYLKTHIKTELEIFSKLLLTEISVRKQNFQDSMILSLTTKLQILSWANIIHLLRKRLKKENPSSSNQLPDLSNLSNPSNLSNLSTLSTLPNLSNLPNPPYPSNNALSSNSNLLASPTSPMNPSLSTFSSSSNSSLLFNSNIFNLRSNSKEQDEKKNEKVENKLNNNGNNNGGSNNSASSNSESGIYQKMEEFGKWKEKKESSSSPKNVTDCNLFKFFKYYYRNLLSLTSFYFNDITASHQLVFLPKEKRRELLSHNSVDYVKIVEAFAKKTMAKNICLLLKTEGIEYNEKGYDWREKGEEYVPLSGILSFPSLFSFPHEKPPPQFLPDLISLIFDFSKMEKRHRFRYYFDKKSGHTFFICKFDKHHFLCLLYSSFKPNNDPSLLQFLSFFLNTSNNDNVRNRFLPNSSPSPSPNKSHHHSFLGS